MSTITSKLTSKLTTRRLIGVLLVAVAIVGGGTYATSTHRTSAHAWNETQAMKVQSRELTTNARVLALREERRGTKTDQTRRARTLKDDPGETGVVHLRVENVIDTRHLGPLAKMNEAQLRQYSNDLITTQNRVLRDSNVKIRVDLAATVFERDYAPKDTHAGTILSDWMDHTDSFPTAKTARRHTNADIIMIIDATPVDACGVAVSANYRFHASQAVATVQPNCQKKPLDDMTYAHELGHTLGLNHDRGVVPKNEIAADPYVGNYGYVDAKNRIHDIMGYDETCRPKNSNESCATIQQYSSPKLQIEMSVLQGERVLRTYTIPLGDSRADAVGFMNSHLDYYAAMNFNAGN